MSVPSAEARVPLVETRSLTRVYDGEIRALDAVNLVIRAGETVSVMGPSGSGKSTLLHLLGALDRPTSGQVLIDGEDLGRLSDLDRHRAVTVGFVFQLHNLLPVLTALENVTVATRGGVLGAEERRERALELLGRVGLASKAERMPQQLSGGERQRVALARALANNPPLLLADEPTGNLDSQSGSEVLELLRELNQELGTTLVMVTHDPVVALATRRILTLRDGRIVHDEAVGPLYLDEMHQIESTALGQLLFGERAEVIARESAAAPA